MRFAFVLTVSSVVAAPTVIQDQVTGVWRGESICAAGRGACVDEQVVYYISAIADKAGVVSIRADKIVNGRAHDHGYG
jgi:hypothetical protein